MTVLYFILSQTLREEEKEIAPDPDDKSGGGGSGKPSKMII